jgi:hypothetical protein
MKYVKWDHLTGANTVDRPDDRIRLCAMRGMGA